MVNWERTNGVMVKQLKVTDGLKSYPKVMDKILEKLGKYTG